MGKSVQESIAAILLSLPEYVEELSNSLRQVSDLLQVGKDEEGIGVFSQTMGAFASLLGLVDALGRSDKVGPRALLKEFERKVEAFTTEIERAREVGDLVTLGDLCAFEAIPILELLLGVGWEGQYVQ